MKIDTKAIQAELDALVNPVLADLDGEVIRRRTVDTMKVAVVVDKQMTSKVGIDFRDTSYRIRLNSTKIRTQGQLDEKVAFVKKEIGGV